MLCCLIAWVVWSVVQCYLLICEGEVWGVRAGPGSDESQVLPPPSASLLWSLWSGGGRCPALRLRGLLLLQVRQSNQHHLHHHHHHHHYHPLHTITTIITIFIPTLSITSLTEFSLQSIFPAVCWRGEELLGVCPGEGGVPGGPGHQDQL